MKYANQLLAVTTAVLLLAAGCGKTKDPESAFTGVDTASSAPEEVQTNPPAPVAKDRLVPTRIENISEGGSIPDGAAAPAAEPDQITPDMLYGEWTLSERPDGEQQSVTVPDTEQGSHAVQCFPRKMKLFPAWATPTGLNNSKDLAEKYANELYYEAELFSGKRTLIPDFATSYAPDALGLAANQNGYYFGAAEFYEPGQITPSGHIGGISGFNRLLYAIDGDTLALGITLQPSEKEPDAFDFVELDYRFEFSDYHLTLYYGDQKAVYVPQQVSYDDEKYQEDIRINRAGTSEPFDGVNGLCYLHNSGEEGVTTQIMRSFHEGYVDTNMQFNPDGSFSIMCLDGTMLNGTYLYSGDTFTLTSGDKTAVYSIYTPAVQSPNSEASPLFMIGDQKIPFFDGARMTWIAKNGMSTDASLDQMIESCAVTDDITVTGYGGSFVIRAVNPYENPVKLEACYIAYVRLDDPDNAAWDGLVRIGQSTYDETNFLFDAPYEEGEHMLRYKAVNNMFLSSQLDFSSALELSKGDMLLKPKGAERIFEFDSSNILKEVRIEIPSLLYNGLEDNVDHAALQSMNPNMMQNVIEVRNDMLHQLVAAFNNATISVTLNQDTGETTMDNSVLFAVDSYELTPEGKQYLDDFIKVYADVLTSDENKKHITEVHFEGHTDSTGSYEYNLALSQKRAEAVMDYCLNSPDNQLTDEQRETLRKVSSAIGYSYSDPVLTNEGAEDAAASRRAAVKFFITA